MQAKHQSARFAVPLLITALLIMPSLSVAQETPQSSSQQPTRSQPSGVTIDPSTGPLRPSEQPSEAPLPDSPQPAATPAPSPRQTVQPAQTTEQPLGAAAAEQIRTAGGAASRPAGNAIAPAKQHQYRSLAIKLGAVAAAAVAAGTVYGLSRATPSTPPHSTVAAAK